MPPYRIQQSRSEVIDLTGSSPPPQTPPPSGRAPKQQPQKGKPTQWTFRVVEAQTQEQISDQLEFLRIAEGNAEVADRERYGQLPVELKAGEVGVVTVEPQNCNDEGLPTYDDDDELRLRIFSQRSQGWRNTKSGLAMRENIEFVKPYAPGFTLPTPEVVLPLIPTGVQRNQTGFEKVTDGVFRKIGHSASSFPHPAVLARSARWRMEDETERRRLVNACKVGSSNAGSLTHIQNTGRLIPEEMWPLDDIRVKDSKGKRYDDYAEHIYTILERAELPVGTQIDSRSITLPNGRKVFGCEDLGLEPTARSTEVITLWGVYTGVTNNILRRWREHQDCIQDAANNGIAAQRSHYRISRFLTQLSRYENRCFCMLSFKKKSDLLKGGKSGRYLAEQLMLSLQECYNPRLRNVRSPPNSANSDSDTSNTIRALDHHFWSTLSRCLSTCTDAALGELGMRRPRSKTNIYIGQNWQSPLAAFDSWASVPFFRIACYNDEGELYKHVYFRPTPSYIRKGNRGQPSGHWFRPLPGRWRYTIAVHDNLPEIGTPIIPIWEIYVEGFGPHPFALLSIPFPGPIEYFWDRSPAVALQVQYIGKNGKPTMQWVKAGARHLMKSGDEASPILKALNKLPYRVDAVCSALSQLECYKWDGGIPDWIRGKAGVSNPLVQDVIFDFAEQELKFKDVEVRPMRQPTLVGGGATTGTPEGLYHNYGEIMKIIREFDRAEAKFKIGTKVHANAEICESEKHIRRRERAQSTSDPISGEVHGSSTILCSRFCRELGRPCIFLTKLGGNKRIKEIRSENPWKLLMGIDSVEPEDRIKEIPGTTDFIALMMHAWDNYEDDGEDEENENDDALDLDWTDWSWPADEEEEEEVIESDEEEDN